MDLQHALMITVQIAREAGDLLRQGYEEEKRIERKSSAVDWVTQYDTAAEALIIKRLQTAFPDHHIIAEESGHNGNPGAYTWYIDPLDGTNNFAHGFPVFCVSLALYAAGQPLLGVIYDPLRDECFTAVRGGGAFLQRGERQTRLQVSQTTALVDALLATGFPYDRHTAEVVENLAEVGAFLQRVQGVRRAGAAALDLAYVAAGRLDGYWEYKLHSWDVAAGVLLVQEAGGQVTLLDGTPFAIAPQLSLTVSNGRLHPLMRDVLQTLTN